MPADFDAPWDDDSFVIINSDGAYCPLDLATQYDQDLVTNPSLTGAPRMALINYQAMTWRPFPLPSTGYSYQIRYRYKPDENVDPYANFTPVFPNDQIIIQALFVEGLQHEDDDRYVPEMQVLQAMVARYKGKFNKQPNKAQKMRFSRRFSTPGNFR